MLGAGLQFNRSRNGDDRFYSAARVRRSQSQSFQSRDRLQRAQTDVAVLKPESGAVADEPIRKNKAVSGASTKPTQSCNLDRFLESVTPSVAAQYLSKTTMRGWRTCDIEFQHYFLLGDLWESFKEWSAYGAGVPLILNDRDSVIQYYVPYLSGIQLYVDPSKTSMKSRRLGEDSDGDSFGDSSSDGSSDCEQERGCSSALMEPQTYYHQKTDVSCRLDQLSVADQHLALQEGFSSDDSESRSSQSCLLFEYFERDQPYSREPLYDKISDLALRFPELKTLRSCDLLSSSWISVAWYPIYRIPMGPTLKDLDACFLTFHCLHTPTAGRQNVHAPVLVHPSELDGVAKMMLPVFGLASYKFRGSLWTPNGGYERQLVNSLLQAADNWLALLQVNHPDFLFFRRR